MNDTHVATAFPFVLKRTPYFGKSCSNPCPHLKDKKGCM